MNGIIVRIQKHKGAALAALIPAIGTCVSNMTGGERRFAYRLEQKLEDDWLLWYDVPLGPRNVHPDFVVFNPRRGLLVLEVKDWKLDTIRDIDRQSAKNDKCLPLSFAGSL